MSPIKQSNKGEENVPSTLEVDFSQFGALIEHLPDLKVDWLSDEGGQIAQLSETSRYMRMPDDIHDSTNRKTEPII